MMTLDAMSGTALKAWTETGAEVLRFSLSRWQQAVEAQMAMMACTGPGEVLKVQTEFYEKALADYRAEAALIAEMMAAPKTVLDALLPVTKRSYDDVPL
nr:phasin family protein [Maliponia aquimaris]